MYFLSTVFPSLILLLLPSLISFPLHKQQLGKHLKGGPFLLIYFVIPCKRREKIDNYIYFANERSLIVWLNYKTD